MRSGTTVALFVFVVVLTVFSVVAVWPSTPYKYLPGDFWPEGRGLKVGGWERETMRLGLDLRGGAYISLQAEPPAGYEGNLAEAVQGAKDVIERRVNALGVSEAEVTTAGEDRLNVQIPGVTLQEAQEQVGRTAILEFKVYNDANQLVPALGSFDDTICLPQAAGVGAPEGCVPMTGQHLRNNTLPVRQGTEVFVQFETTGQGSDLLGDITRNATRYQVGDPRRLLVITLDEEIISSANVQAVLTDGGVITGGFSFTEARDLSELLNSGALPVPFRVIQASEVSATLGEDSVIDSAHAGEIGLLAVVIFMILYYRLPGVMAALALGVYTAITLMVFKLWPITLTLSGIAAFVLSIGMAVDANVLIFERMKEELRRGRTLNSAIDIGFRRAFSSIQDSNVATLITCVILYWFGDQFGASLVKGFALTLAIGVFISLFSAITVTRTFLKMAVGTPLARWHWGWNAHETRVTASSGRTQHGGAKRPLMIDFAGKRWSYMSVSLVLSLVACVALGLWQLRPGIEFTSGSTFTFEFTAQTVAQDELSEALAELGHEEARVQRSGENEFLIRTAELEGPAPTSSGPGIGPEVPIRGEIDDIQSALCSRFGSTAADGTCTGVVRKDFSTVSETVSSEIARYATIAVVAAALAITLYIAWAFRRMHRPWRYGLAALAALVHDAIIILGLFAILGEFRGTEVDTAFITAILTVIGFSVHDTIVVFDRIRERVSNDPYIPFPEAVNASLTETLARSLNTSFVVVITVIAMLLIGGESIRSFLLVLLVGIVAGAYSSIGLAAQVLVAWENNDVGKFWNRIRGRKAAILPEAV